MIFGHWDHLQLKQVNWLYYYHKTYRRTTQIWNRFMAKWPSHSPQWISLFNFFCALIGNIERKLLYRQMYANGLFYFLCYIWTVFNIFAMGSDTRNQHRQLGPLSWWFILRWGLLNVLPDGSALVQKAKLPVKDCISFNVTLRLDKVDVNWSCNFSILSCEIYKCGNYFFKSSMAIAIYKILNGSQVQIYTC
jgi:hypothetical protein